MKNLCFLSEPKRLLYLTLAFSSVLNINYSLAADTEKSQLDEQAKIKIQTFAKALKSTLQQAIKTGGLTAGIEVCQQEAPIIAQRLSTKGWTVSRTSLKTRNSSNQAKPWQKEVLLQFQKQLEHGLPAEKLSFSQIDDSSYKFMKAIPTGQLCLSCHGSTIPASVKDKIDELYPADKAINFSLKDIRGAFVVEKQHE